MANAERGPVIRDLWRHWNYTLFVLFKALGLLLFASYKYPPECKYRTGKLSSLQALFCFNCGYYLLSEMLIPFKYVTSSSFWVQVYVKLIFLQTSTINTCFIRFLTKSDIIYLMWWKLTSHFLLIQQLPLQVVFHLPFSQHVHFQFSWNKNVKFIYPDRTISS